MKKSKNKIEVGTLAVAFDWIGTLISWIRTLQRTARELRGRMHIQEELRNNHAQAMDDFRNTIIANRQSLDITFNTIAEDAGQQKEAIDKLQLQVQSMEGRYNELATTYEKMAEQRQANFNKLLDSQVGELQRQINNVAEHMTTARLNQISTKLSDTRIMVDRHEKVMRGAATVTISDGWTRGEAETYSEKSLDGDIAIFLNEVRREIYLACTKFPDPQCSVAALGEEFGELCKAMLDEDTVLVRKEAIQVACMAFRVAVQGDPTLANYRMRKGGPGPHPPTVP